MPPNSRDSAFLNIPYDDQYRELYFAFIAGLCAFALIPSTSLEVPGGERRLDRIFELMTNCRYSFHDLSRVQLDRDAPRTPRFNMPFELGLLVGWLKTNRNSSHTWFVFESVERRLQKSLSDLDGTDPYIHEGKVRGVLRQLSNALVKTKYEPTVQQMYSIYRYIKTVSPLIIRSCGARSLFEACVFKRLGAVATGYAEEILKASKPRSTIRLLSSST